MLKPAFVPRHTKMAAEKAIWTLFVLEQFCFSQFGLNP